MLAPDRRPHRTADGYICILPYTDRHSTSQLVAAARTLPEGVGRGTQ